MNNCDMSTASLHESSHPLDLSTVMQHTQPHAIRIDHSPSQGENNSFSTPPRLTYPSDSFVMPKERNTTVANALLSQCRHDAYLTPNCTSTPQIMVDPSCSIGLHVCHSFYLYLSRNDASYILYFHVSVFLTRKGFASL